MKNKYLTLILFLFSIHLINAKEKKNEKIEEVLKLETSSVFSIKTDSLVLKSKFDKISDLNNKQEYVKALKEALNLLEESKKFKNNYWIFKCNYLIAEVYRKTNRFQKAIEYYNESLLNIRLSKVDKSYLKFSDSDYFNSLLHLGTSYHAMHVSINFNKNHSKKDSIRLVHIKKKYIDSALTIYKKIEKLPSVNPEVEVLKGTAFNNISNIYEEDSLYTKAEYYALKAIEIHKKNKNNLKIAASLNKLGNISLSQKKYQKAKNIYI